MLDILKSLADIVITLVSFIIQTITSIIDLITRIPTYTVYLFDMIGILPSFIIPIATALIAIWIVQYITNRKAG